MPPLSQRDRAEQKRRERLELMDQQVREGSLTIRQMTPARPRSGSGQPRRNEPAAAARTSARAG